MKDDISDWKARATSLSAEWKYAVVTSVWSTIGIVGMKSRRSVRD